MFFLAATSCSSNLTPNFFQVATRCNCGRNLGVFHDARPNLGFCHDARALSDPLLLRLLSAVLASNLTLAFRSPPARPHHHPYQKVRCRFGPFCLRSAPGTAD